jgi:hypothetical protein
MVVTFTTLPFEVDAGNGGGIVIGPSGENASALRAGRRRQHPIAW